MQKTWFRYRPEKEPTENQQQQGEELLLLVQVRAVFAEVVRWRRQEKSTSDQWEVQKGPHSNRSCRQHRGVIKEEAAVEKAAMQSNERKKLLQENL
jgi:hypothetical protein